MIKTIFILLVLYLIIERIIINLKSIKTNDKRENNQNFWMHTYDFKEIKKKSIFDRDSKNLTQRKDKKNKLILLLYLTTILAFILLNNLVAQILSAILN
tara:strand:+ start:664 stop:960 length:297 start_codon:yes stop_codon:yes gene_type:complete